MKKNIKKLLQIDTDLFEHLKRSAKENNRSVTGEIIYRLKKSF